MVDIIKFVFFLRLNNEFKLKTKITYIGIENTPKRMINIDDNIDTSNNPDAAATRCGICFYIRFKMHLIQICKYTQILGFYIPDQKIICENCVLWGGALDWWLQIGGGM